MRAIFKLRVPGFLQNAGALRRAKPVLFFGSLLLAVVLLLGSTMAWFISSDSVLNPMRREEPAKLFDVVEVDVFPPGQDTSTLMEKRVGAQNVGDLPAFVRLLVLPVFKAQDGSLLPARLGVPGNDPINDPPVPPEANVIVTDLNLASWELPGQWEGGDWADGGDGYFYYLHRLDPGASTDALETNLFEHLQLVLPPPPGYENASLLIEVKSEAVDPFLYRDAWWAIPNNATPASPPIPALLLDSLLHIDERLQGELVP